jgi:hypothetical protein
MIFLSLLIAAPTSGSAPPVEVARCPSTIDATAALPAGARLVTAAPERALPLTFAGVIDDAVDAGAAATIPAIAAADTVEVRDGHRQDRYELRPTAAEPASLVCRYGRYDGVGWGEAALLVPLPARGHVTCVLKVDVRRRPARPRPAAMTCVAD